MVGCFSVNVCNRCDTSVVGAAYNVDALELTEIVVVAPVKNDPITHLRRIAVVVVVDVDIAVAGSLKSIVVDTGRSDNLLGSRWNEDVFGAKRASTTRHHNRRS